MVWTAQLGDERELANIATSHSRCQIASIDNFYFCIRNAVPQVLQQTTRRKKRDTPQTKPNQKQGSVYSNHLAYNTSTALWINYPQALQNCSYEFPGLPTIQFLITCSMQKRRGKAWSWMSSVSTEGSWSKECFLRIRSSFWTKSSVFFCLANVQYFSGWDRNYKKRSHSFNPPSFCLPRDTDVIHMIKWTSIFAY